MNFCHPGNMKIRIQVVRVLSAATLKYVGVCACAFVCVCVFKWKGHIINTCRTLKFASLRRWRCLSQALSAHAIQWRRGWLQRWWATLIGLLIPCQNYNVNEIMLGTQEQKSTNFTNLVLSLKRESAVSSSQNPPQTGCEQCSLGRWCLCGWCGCLIFI